MICYSLRLAGGGGVAVGDQITAVRAGIDAAGWKAALTYPDRQRIRYGRRTLDDHNQFD